MRRYIRKQDLQITLQSILSRQDQELLDVYKEVVMYHVSGDSRKYRHAAASLAVPRKIGLSLLNLALLPAFATALQILMPPVFAAQAGCAVFAVFLLFTYFQFRSLCLSIARLQLCKPYLIVDELIVRKIIILQKKQKSKTAV